MGLRYGGKIVDDYSAMQGPCPDGFHVPTKDEWVALYNIGVRLGVRTSSSGDAVKTYLKMPFAGYRVFRSAEVNYQGTGALCWSSNRNSASYAYYFTVGSTSINAQGTNIRSHGYTVRCFKDTPVTPDSSWTTLYQGTGSSGIFHSSSLGLISLSSDGTIWITIQDKNLGATTVYNNGDTLSEANCGKYFQWGNNYGFAWTGSVTTSSTQVDASNYGPGNYYSSSTFITRSSSPYRRDTTDNGNLWGGETGVQQRPAPIVKRYYGGKMVDDYSAMQGPAPSGYHVPLTTEWQGLKTIMDGLSLTTGNSWRINLHMPFAGYRDYGDGDVYDQGGAAYYWSSSPRGGLPEYAWNLIIDPSIVYPSSSDNHTNGQSLRCFKDSYVTPDSSWTVVQGTLGSAGIFWNQSKGLISITDGTTGYTIMDKNLGATTVYNDGDTLTQTNMGNIYQWGNNYGFPSTGTISNTSSTQVDASAYGPGNYYLSDTFITGSEDWSSVNNEDLWGGVTGVQQRPAEVIKVYKGNTLIREKS